MGVWKSREHVGPAELAKAMGMSTSTARRRADADAAMSKEPRVKTERGRFRRWRRPVVVSFLRRMGLADAAKAIEEAGSGPDPDALCQVLKRMPREKLPEVAKCVRNAGKAKKAKRRK